ncbi:LysR family transcriptional regulator [Murinocardiopsis flavida]|nr:LysR family transcriptional regulator [Murinocardiopsis flavida]
MNVELRHLRALAAIGDDGTITGAAAALGISQPALSRTLDQMERRLGALLVERTTRALQLTPEGKRLWEHAHVILAHLDDALAEVTTGPRPLRVGFSWGALGRHTVPLLRGWRATRPDVPVSVHRLGDPEPALRRGDIDLAFLRVLPRDDAFYVLPLFREQRIAAVAEGDPLASRTRLRLADLADRRVALCATAATTSAGLWPVGGRPDTGLHVENADEWLTVIATGEAVGVTGEATAHSHPHPDVHYLAIEDAPTITVHLAWAPVPAHPEIAAFRDYARSTIGAAEPAGAIP